MNGSNKDLEPEKTGITEPENQDALTWFERHPNLTLFFVWLVANLLVFLGARIWTLANNSVSVEGSDYGSILGFGLIVFSIVLVLAGEIWNIHQKGRSLFNLFWNLIPYIGFFMILWLDYPVISVKIISPSNVLALGSTLQLKATETRLNGSTNGEIVANWESSNKDIATVTSGVVTGVHSGICEITAFSGGVTSEPVILTITE